MSWAGMLHEAGRRRLRAAGALAAAAAAGAALGMSLAHRSEAAQPAQTFEAPAGLILNYIRADRTAAFESVAGRLAGALAGSESAEHRAQASGWKMYRAIEPGPNGNVLYVWLFDPAVAGADYSAAGLLRETFPTEVQSLYEAFNGAFGVGQALINMEPVDAF